MQEIKEILHIVTNNRLKKIETLYDLPEGKGGRIFQKICRGLLAGRLNNDEEVAAFTGLPAGSANFRMIKMRMRNRLFNSLFFIDTSKKQWHPLSKTRLTISRNLYCCSVLMAFSLKETANDLLKKTLAMAEEYQLTEAALICVRHLRSAISLEGRKKEFDYYQRRAEELKELYSAEDRVMTYYQDVHLHYASSSGYNPEYINRVVEYARQANEIYGKHQSSEILQTRCKLNAFAYFLTGQYEEAVEAWNELENFFIQNPKFRKTAVTLEIRLNQLECYLHMRDYERGRLKAEACKECLVHGNYNWFVFMEVHFLLCMHSRNYQESISVLQEVLTHKNFLKLQETVRERWAIHQAYSQFVQSSLTGSSEGIEFRPGRLVNETPVYAKDKKGLNISILILQVLFRIHRGEFDLASSQIEHLQVYNRRYLKNDHFLRTQLFILMLVELHKAEYDYDKTREKAAGLKKRLLETRLVNKDSADVMEIIPYEDLWMMIKVSLKKEKKYAVNH